MVWNRREGRRCLRFIPSGSVIDSGWLSIDDLCGLPACRVTVCLFLCVTSVTSRRPRWTRPRSTSSARRTGSSDGEEEAAVVG